MFSRERMITAEKSNFLLISEKLFYYYFRIVVSPSIFDAMLCYFLRRQQWYLLIFHVSLVLRNYNKIDKRIFSFPWHFCNLSDNIFAAAACLFSVFLIFLRSDSHDVTGTLEKESIRGSDNSATSTRRSFQIQILFRIQASLLRQTSVIKDTKKSVTSISWKSDLHKVKPARLNFRYLDQPVNTCRFSLPQVFFFLSSNVATWGVGSFCRSESSYSVAKNVVVED